MRSVVGSKPKAKSSHRLWVDAPTLAIIAGALGLVVAMAVVIEQEQPAPPSGTRGPTLHDFERVNPHLSVRQEHVSDPQAQPGAQHAGMVLLHLQDAQTGARATLREDLLLGHPVRLGPCPPALPVAPALRDVQCLVAVAAGDKAEAQWLTARLPAGTDGPDAEFEKLQAFYARADAAAGEQSLVLHRLSAERIAVGLLPREAVLAMPATAAAAAAAASHASQ